MDRFPRNWRMPDPWIGNIYVDDELQSEGVPAAPAVATWPSANLAMYVPIVFPVDCRVYQMAVVLANATDNYDLGFYNPDFSKAFTKGSTAVAAGLATLSFGRDYRVLAGEVYYAALAMNGTTSQYQGSVPPGGTGPQRNANTGQQASAFALPDPIVPAQPTNIASIPIFAFGIR